MTPAEEQAFITLWQQGASYRELAAALGCPLGTVASRSAALVAQGKITPRQRGGAYPNRRAKARQEDPPAPVQRPVQSLDTGKASLAQAKESPRCLSNTWCCKQMRRRVRLPA
jgi:DNA-binding transcriptional MocR family regulator